MKRLHEIAVMVFPALLIGVLVFHFGATFASQLPASPIALRLQSRLPGYFTPYFEQRWTMFAPDTRMDTRYMLVACRTQRADGVIEEQPWVNATAPLRNLKSRYRFTPATRVERAQLGPFYDIFQPEESIVTALREHADKVEQLQVVLDGLDAERAQQAEEAIRVARRVASVECDRLYGPGATVEVNIRLVAQPLPAFSKRREPVDEADSVAVEFGWDSHEQAAAY